MQSVYKIIVKPYGYDFWYIFTKDKEMFDRIAQLGNTDQARSELGSEVWDNLVDGDFLKPPYILLGETVLHQRD